MIRILIADDNELVRRGLADLLSAEPDIEVCGTAETGEAAVELAETCAPDVVLLDLTMPGAGGIAAAAMIRRTAPQVRVLVVSCHDDVDHVRGALGAGALGYILKDARAAEVVGAVRAVSRGEACLSPDAARAVQHPPSAVVSAPPTAGARARARHRSRRGPWPRR
jgi:DNA-binding NarL/FixJ family response regulator